MFVAIEGMDGVGKTTLAKKISQSYGYSYVERPMQKALNITSEQYDDICNFIWSKDNKNIVLAFFILGNLFTRYYGENIVVDRHILSSYYWDSNEQNEEIFSYFYKGDVVPDLTLILYASAASRKERIIQRNANDPDLLDMTIDNSGYDKMLKFAQKNEMPYILVNTEQMNEDEVFKYCSGILSNYFDENMTNKKGFCNYYNSIFSNTEDEQKQNKKVLLK